MMQAFAFVHCDGCHRMYEKPHAVMFSDPCDWWEGIEALAGSAEKAGWYIGPNWSNLLCTACNDEFSKVEF
jgi:hypothetical protein